MVDPSTDTVLAGKSTLDEKLKYSLEVLRQAFEQYAADKLFISFNGGKDCTVLLHLVDRVLRECRLGSERPNVLCLYLQPEHPFEEVETFVESCPSAYSIVLEKSTPGRTKQNALFQLCNQHPALQACLMGCRRTDPWCEKLGTLEKTTEGWPDLMRINPLLDWTCADIWDYIQLYNVPYCSLYDVGYTSLGEKTNTLPNPHLKYLDESTGTSGYRPAYHLKHSDELERVGRIIVLDQKRPPTT